MNVTDSQGLLKSDLWLDQPDALDRIDAKLRVQDLDDAQAERLRGFVENGFLAIHLDDSDELLDQVCRDVDLLWKKKPLDLAFAYDGGLQSMSDADERRHRLPRYRIADLHSHSEAARRLYFHPQIFHWIDLIFGSPSVSFQSLFFEWGSEQSFHRDPVYVVTTPPANLLATWVALEDISPDCGPLSYIPGSHKVPYYQFSPGRISIRPGEDYLPAYDFTTEECRKRELEGKAFACSKGDVFIWHGSLVHGGSPVDNPALTRRSFVVHYSTLGDYQARGTSFSKVCSDKPVDFSRQTREIVRQDGSSGFESPMRGFRPPRFTAPQRLRSWLRRF